MFWKPQTRTEWALVIGIGLCTVARILRGGWVIDQDHLGVQRPIRLVDDLVIVLLWLVYGFLRAQIRKRRSGEG